MSYHHDMTGITLGAEVVGTDGEKIGTIKSTGPDHFLVHQGFLFSHDQYLPAYLIGEATHDRVNLNITKNEAERIGVVHLPRPGDPWYTGSATPDYPGSSREDYTTLTDFSPRTYGQGNDDTPGEFVDTGDNVPGEATNDEPMEITQSGESGSEQGL